MTASARLRRLRDRLDELELDAILISSPENRRYLSGFTGSNGYLVISQEAAVLATDFRYVEQAGGQAPDFRVDRIAGGLGWFPKLVSEIGVARVGFESDHMTVAGYSAFTKAVEDAESGGGTTLVSTAGVVEKLRAIKDEAELDLMARAVEIADAAIDRIGPTIERGVTEQAVAWELEKAMRSGGAEAIAFDIIVAAGPNAAHPHHRADDKRVQSGEAVVIDMGASYLGYCSDLTRTIIVGEPDDTLRRVFDTVLRAQLAAEERVATGMTGGEADAIGREIIAKAGYGDNFGHSLGHGIGLAVHEYPRVGPGSEDPLENGMVFSIEPGIYVPGWGGVRIEDLVVLENGRARVLTKARKYADT